MQIRQCPSTHFNSRPHCDVELLVIHSISLPPGQFDGHYIEDFFCGKLDYCQHEYFQSIKTLQVSSHFLIKRTGEVIQFIDCDNRAWHAGASLWKGRDNCNDFSIGIELEGTDELRFTEDQYQSLQSLTLLLMRRYPKISLENIVGHSDIAPGRKTDPGPMFDWNYYRKLLSESKPE